MPTPANVRASASARPLEPSTRVARVTAITARRVPMPDSSSSERSSCTEAGSTCESMSTTGTPTTSMSCGRPTRLSRRPMISATSAKKATPARNPPSTVIGTGGPPAATLLTGIGLPEANVLVKWPGSCCRCALSEASFFTTALVWAVRFVSDCSALG